MKSHKILRLASSSSATQVQCAPTPQKTIFWIRLWIAEHDDGTYYDSDMTTTTTVMMPNVGVQVRAYCLACPCRHQRTLAADDVRLGLSIPARMAWLLLLLLLLVTGELTVRQVRGRYVAYSLYTISYLLVPCVKAVPFSSYGGWIDARFV